MVPGNHDYGGTAALWDPLNRHKHEGRFIDLVRHCGRPMHSIGTGGATWPTRTEVAGGRCIIYGVHSTAAADDLPGFATGNIGKRQLDDLAADLGQLEPFQRRVIVLHHHPCRIPIGRKLVQQVLEGDFTMGLRDRRAFQDCCIRHNVDLVLHGHRHYFVRRRVGATTVLQAPSTSKGMWSHR